MGANKWRKDILVEVDWMAAGAPQASLWQKVEQAFNDAPVLNPDDLEESTSSSTTAKEVGRPTGDRSWRTVTVSV